MKSNVVLKNFQIRNRARVVVSTVDLHAIRQHAYFYLESTQLFFAAVVLLFLLNIPTWTVCLLEFNICGIACGWVVAKFRSTPRESINVIVFSNLLRKCVDRLAYVINELSYQTLESRCLYFQKLLLVNSNFQHDSIPLMKLIKHLSTMQIFSARANIVNSSTVSESMNQTA